MEKKKDSKDKSAQNAKTSSKKPGAKKLFYKEKWFCAVVAVVLAVVVFGVGVMVGRLSVNKDNNEIANVDNSSEQNSSADQLSQNSDSKKENGNSSNNSSSSSNGSSSGSDSSLNGSDASASGDLMNDGIGTYGVGQTVKYKGYEVKVTKFERNYKPKSSSVKPGTGKEFVRITVEIKNISNDSGNYSVLDWDIEDSNGKEGQYSIEASCTLDNSCMSADDLPVGKSTKGTLAFEVDKNSSWFVLHYRPNFQWNEDGAIFELF